MAGRGGRTSTSGQGRPKGVPNKATADVRATMALIAERNVEKFELWLNSVAESDPHKAASLFLQAIEYHIPKLARTEHAGDANAPIRVEQVPMPAVDKIREKAAKSAASQ